MSSAIQEKAEARGWLVVGDTATENLVVSLTESRLPALLPNIDPEPVKRGLSWIDLPLVKGSVSWDTISM